jgi:outer membrane receptor for ferrienterochelin and colicin
VELNKNMIINVELSPKAFVGEEVVISATRSDQNIQSTDVGKVDVPIETIKSLPAFMGEVDVLKAIQLLPGVQASGEGNTGFYVRGGGPDQNLIMLDEATIYNAGHLFGFFSVFNADAIKTVELTKAGMPAYYGGRLASVLDIYMKEGNQRKFQVDGGVGLIFSRLTVQGPIKKDTSSFIVSARRTYIDVLAQPFLSNTSPLKKSSFYFYDLNAKVNYSLSDKDKLYLSGYFGNDVYGFNSKQADMKNNFEWGNASGSLRWTHLFNNKLFMNTSAILSDYHFKFTMSQNIYDITLNSGVRDWNGKVDFTYIQSPKQTIRFGVNYLYHIFTPSTLDVEADNASYNIAEPKKFYAHDGALYVNDELDITKNIRINGGLRYTLFQQIGPFDRFVLDNQNRVSDTISYASGKPVATYQGLEPRFSVRWTLNKKSSVKASFAQNYQYIHQVSLSSISLPTDLWVPCTSIIKPQFGTQYAIGYYRNFKEDLIETSLELYYKNMKNLVEYKEGASPYDDMNNNPDNNYTFGKGWSYGGELFIKKAKGKLTGWIGYTLSWTKRQFPDINQGKEFYAKYDRRNDVSITASYKLNKRFEFSAVWVYSSGNTMTIPVGRYFISGNFVTEYSDKNAYRLPPYHRLDLSVTYTIKKTNKVESALNLSVYNAYNRMNPFYIYLETTGNLQNFDIQTKAVQMSLFPILPSLSWNFKF